MDFAISDFSAEAKLMFCNDGGGKFEEVRAVKGTGPAVLTSGRGAAFGDLFKDGKIDAMINPDDGPPVPLRNVKPDHHHGEGLKLIGGSKTATSTGSLRDAVGATVYLSPSGMWQRRDLISSASSVSTNAPRPHFGLGDATDAVAAETHSPSGAKETVKLPAVDRIFIITGGMGITGALCGGMPCPIAKPASVRAVAPGAKP